MWFLKKEIFDGMTGGFPGLGGADNPWWYNQFYMNGTWRR
jgi:hypothetical protein